jgi:tRNA(Ile)-lysidine synthase
MIRLACKIPERVILACSGGRDSMSALEFLLRGRREVELAYFNHETAHSHDAENFVIKHAKSLGLTYHIGLPLSSKEKKESLETYWHRERHRFFEKFDSNVVLAHHLSDATEWWIFSSLRGKPGLMPVKKPKSNIMRPFLLSSKSDLHRFDKFDFIEDPSNQSLKHARNVIRHKMRPVVQMINPGIETTVRNLYND